MQIGAAAAAGRGKNLKFAIWKKSLKSNFWILFLFIIYLLLLLLQKSIYKNYNLISFKSISNKLINIKFLNIFWIIYYYYHKNEY